VSRFVYGTRGHVPDYMIRGGSTYRILGDTVGSPRIVVDVATCAVVQRLAYDEFGRVLSDSNPGFQPLGFAGGLYDRDLGLVRFGARDYDPEIGRWTAKDPVGFGGGDSNLYAYAGNSPVQFIDPTGLSFWDGVTDFAAGFGDTITFGGTRWVRQQLGVDDVVNPCSGWYGAGQITAVGVGAALAAGTAAAALGEGALIGAGGAGGGSVTTYEILDGVRRAKAAELAGKASIVAKVMAGDRVVATTTVLIENLRSPFKSAIDVSSRPESMQRFLSIMQATRLGDRLPPITVQLGIRGPSIFDIFFE
jgi:RHS repeat-associated protein